MLCCYLGSYIDEGAEWRIYANTEDDPSRTGTITSELLPNSSYGSMMMRKRIPNQSEESKSIASKYQLGHFLTMGALMDGYI
jgi:hypothetical protein